MAQYWLDLEQTYISTLSKGDIEIAEGLLDQICQKFPSSLRVKRLLGMLAEAKGISVSPVFGLD